MYRERIAEIEADITALQQRRHDFQRVAHEAREAHDAGQLLSRDARLQQEWAELMVQVLGEQIEEQFAARAALIPKARTASDG